MPRAVCCVRSCMPYRAIRRHVVLKLSGGEWLVHRVHSCHGFDVNALAIAHVAVPPESRGCGALPKGAADSGERWKAVLSGGDDCSLAAIDAHEFSHRMPRTVGPILGHNYV
jgi:hypothetical protein